MKRFLASIVLFLLIFSNFWVLFQPLSAEELYEDEDSEVAEEVVVKEDSEVENIIEENSDETNEEAVDEEVWLLQDELQIEDESWDEEIIEDVENWGMVEEEQSEIENISEDAWEEEEDLWNESMELDDNIDLINLNFASHAELIRIKWVGNKTAENIIAYREVSLFCDIDELINVKGIWPTTLINIKEWWYVEHIDCTDVSDYNDTDMWEIREEGYESNIGDKSSEDTENIADELWWDNIWETGEASEQRDNTNDEELIEEQGNEENQESLWNNSPEDTWTTLWENEWAESVMIPEIQYEFQNWTYLIPQDESDIFLCDTSKEYCRVNYNFELSFTGWFLARDFYCEIDFGFWEITGEEEKCNPAGIIYPEWIFETKIRITEKNNAEQWSEKILIIQNIPQEEEWGLLISNISEWSDWWIWDISQELWVWEITKVDNFEIIYEFQRPTDIAPILDSVNAYDCDRSRQDCRVNLDYRTSFTSDFPTRNYTCTTDFWFWETGEEEKCNPNTVIFPLWVHEVSITVQENSGEEKVYKQTFSVRNLWYLVPVKNNTSGASNTVTQKSKIDISLPRVEVQSGVEAMDGTWKFFRCLKKDCKVNLNYKKRHSLERCLWDFGVGVQSHPETHLKCNPGFVTFPHGDHEVYLTVYEHKNDANSLKLLFFINNLWEEELQENHNYDIIENNKIIENNIIDIWNIEITLQWRIWKEKIYDSENQELTCIWVEKCSVNLIWEIENSKRWLNYIWYNNDEIFFENINPPAQWLESWEYEILFEIYHDDILLWSSIFFVIVEWKENSWNSKNKKQKDTEPWLFDTLVHDWIEIYDFLADPIGSDMKEFIELRNTTSEARDLYGCYLEDNAKRKYRFKQGEYLWAYQQKRFFRPQTKLTLWNQRWRIAIFCNSEKIQNIIWETKVREWISFKWKYIWVFQPEYIRSELSDEHYASYVKNVFWFSARSLKYDWLRVSWETFPYSKLEWFIWGQRFFSLTTWESWKYSFTTKNIGTWKYEVDYVLTDMLWEVFELKSRSFTIKSGATQFWNTPRPWSAPRVPTLRIVPQASTDNTPNSIDNSDVVLRRFLLLWVILFIVFIASWHIFTLTFRPSMALRELQVRTKVRTELIFLLPSN